MEKKTAINILKGRAVLGIGVTKNVPVTNVSFKDAEGQPFVWESGDSEGEPYAIANINAMNHYGKQQAELMFANGDYQEACNTNLSARVSLEKGRQLNNALLATVQTEEREIDVKDDNGETTGETEMAILIGKIVPNEADDFASKKVEFDFGSEDDTNGMPQTTRRAENHVNEGSEQSGT